MKSLLLSTDFSDTANHAVKYGYQLAQKLRANVILCHIFMFPAEVPQGGVVVWPTDSYTDVLKDNEDQLRRLSDGLRSDVKVGDFKPAVKLINDTGLVADVVRNAAQAEKSDMIIVGTHQDTLSALFTGNHSKTLIDQLDKPLLLVPPKAQLQLPRRVTFASDFKHPDQDLQMILSLMPFITKLDVELFITHIEPTGVHAENQIWLSQFLKDVGHRSNYPKIFSKLITDDNRASALQYLCSGSDTDLLVMVHRQHGFFEELFKGSYTKKTAKTTMVPLLVLHPAE